MCFSNQNDMCLVIKFCQWIQEDCKEWRAMRHAYGAVWDMPNPPKGPLDLRFQVSGSFGEKLVQLRGAIPADWKAGVAYDTAIQLN